MRFVDPGEYTLETLVTFLAPQGFDDFPIDNEDGGDGRAGVRGVHGRGLTRRGSG